MQQFKLKSVKKSNVCSAIVCCSVFLFSVLYADNVLATVYNVNNTADGHAVNQLRGAFEAADAAGPGPHTINVAAGTYALTLGMLILGSNPQTISIIGAGAASTIISKSTNPLERDRIFLINPVSNGGGRYIFYTTMNSK
jgi:hypothetical protein